MNIPMTAHHRASVVSRTSVVALLTILFTCCSFRFAEGQSKRHPTRTNYEAPRTYDFEAYDRVLEKRSGREVPPLKYPGYKLGVVDSWIEDTNWSAGLKVEALNEAVRLYDHQIINKLQCLSPGLMDQNQPFEAQLDLLFKNGNPAVLAAEGILDPNVIFLNAYRNALSRSQGNVYIVREIEDANVQTVWTAVEEQVDAVSLLDKYIAVYDRALLEPKSSDATRFHYEANRDVLLKAKNHLINLHRQRNTSEDAPAPESATMPDRDKVTGAIGLAMSLGCFVFFAFGIIALSTGVGSSSSSAAAEPLKRSVAAAPLPLVDWYCSPAGSLSERLNSFGSQSF